MSFSITSFGSVSVTWCVQGLYDFLYVPDDLWPWIDIQMGAAAVRYLHLSVLPLCVCNADKYIAKLYLWPSNRLLYSINDIGQLVFSFALSCSVQWQNVFKQDHVCHFKCVLANNWLKTVTDWLSAMSSDVRMWEIDR